MRQGPRKARWHASCSPPLRRLHPCYLLITCNLHPLWAEVQPVQPSPATGTKPTATLPWAPGAVCHTRPGARTTLCCTRLGARTTPCLPGHPAGARHLQGGCPRQQQLSAQFRHLRATTSLGAVPLPCPQLASSRPLKCLSSFRSPAARPFSSQCPSPSATWDAESAPPLLQHRSSTAMGNHPAPFPQLPAAPANYKLSRINFLEVFEKKI